MLLPALALLPHCILFPPILTGLNIASVDLVGN